MTHPHRSPLSPTQTFRTCCLTSAKDTAAAAAVDPYGPNGTGLSGPLGITFDADGTAFASDSHPAATSGRTTAGRVWAVPPGGGDVAEVGEVVVGELPNGRHNTNGMEILHGRLYITNGNSTDDGVDGGEPEEPLSGTLLSVAVDAGSQQLPEQLMGLHTSTNGLAFAPAGGGWHGDLFVALFGNFFGDEIVGQRIARVPIDEHGASSQPEGFVFLPAPLDLTFVGETMYVADFAAGVVVVPPPA